MAGRRFNGLEAFNEAFAKHLATRAKHRAKPKPMRAPPKPPEPNPAIERSLASNVTRRKG